MADTYEAMIDDFLLEIENIDDSFEKSIARYEFPYRDGALLEDMGQKARSIKLRCYFFEDTYLDHIEFINHLEKKELFELTHPKYGIIEGAIESVSVRHDDRSRTAEIDLTFIENLRGEIEPVEYIEVESATEDAFVRGQEE